MLGGALRIRLPGISCRIDEPLGSSNKTGSSRRKLLVKASTLALDLMQGHPASVGKVGGRDCAYCPEEANAEIETRSI